MKLFQLFTDLIQSRKKASEVKVNTQRQVYQMFKDNVDIKHIIKQFNLTKEEIITMVRDEKSIRRGE